MVKTMLTITDLAGDYRLPVTAIALGTFDGVHAGHQRIIRRAVELAKQTAGESLVFTSCTHPLAMLAPEQCPPMIAARWRKIELIRAQGADYLCMIPFTPDFLRIGPEEFIDLLCRRFAPRYIVVGPNYTFGHKGAGTVETLESYAGRYGFSVTVPEAVCLDGEMVSSTAIRKLIAAGAVTRAARMLTRPVSLYGQVNYRENNRLTPNADRTLIEVAVQPGLVVPAGGLYHISLKSNAKRHNCLATLTASEPAGGRCILALKLAGGLTAWDSGLEGRVVEIELAAPAAGALFPAAIPASITQQ